MSEVEDVLTSLAAKMAFDPKAKSMSFTFVLDGGEVWTVTPGSVQGQTQNGRCILELSRENLLSIFRKTSNPQALYMKGALRVSGEVGDALKLADLW